MKPAKITWTVPPALVASRCTLQMWLLSHVFGKGGTLAPSHVTVGEVRRVQSSQPYGNTPARPMSSVSPLFSTPVMFCIWPPAFQDPPPLIWNCSGAFTPYTPLMSTVSCAPDVCVLLLSVNSARFMPLGNWPRSGQF